MNDDMVDQIADILVDDHVALLKENARLRDLVSEMLGLLRELMEHLYVVSDEDDTKADELIKWGINIRDRLEGEGK